MPNNQRPGLQQTRHQRLRVRYERLRSSAPLEILAEGLRHQPGLALFANGITGHTYLTADPYAWVSWQAGDAFDPRSASSGFDELARVVLAEAEDADDAPVPFCGGAVGQINYEAGYRFDRVRSAAIPAATEIMRFGLYGWVVARDDASGETWLLVNGKDRREHGTMAGRRTLLATNRPRRPAAPVVRSPQSFCDFTRQGYMRTVERIQDYISAGDVYQVNLARRLSGRLGTDPWNIFLRLRSSGQDSMAAYWQHGNQALVSASPELLLLHRGNTVETRPIKGTRPRGDETETDHALARELTSSAKDLAENVMIVDVLRNDLGRVALPGSVTVPKLARLATNPRIHHLESTIRARVDGPTAALRLLQAMFPGGSVTGAPKLRAMEIIAQLEPVARGGYCGAFAQIGFNGYISASIPIRTIFCQDRHWQFHVGGGVVADSQPLAEYQETQHKANALLDALGAI